MTDDQILQEAEDVAAMLNSPGWKWVKQYVQDTTEACIRKLLNTPDGPESTSLKAQILALKVVVRDAETLVEAARRKQQKDKEELEDQTPQA